MKKIWCMVLAMVLVFGTLAFGESESEWNIQINERTAVPVDLDGDGAAEMVEWKSLTVGDYEEAVTVRINGKHVWTMDYLTRAQVYMMDMDGDGGAELLVSGDQMSDDYLTACLKWENGAVSEIPFETAYRGMPEEGVAQYGYGMITAFGIDNGVVELTGSQDVLGTYFGTRTYRLQDGCFVLADDGFWRFDRDPDLGLMQFGSLTLTEDIPVAFADGDGMLYAGEQIYITASDKKTAIRFITEDGREGSFAFEYDKEGWGVIIDGRHESELFEYIPYAD